MENKELNKKLAEWAGFEWIADSENNEWGIWQRPDGIKITHNGERIYSDSKSRYLPNFTESLDACFKWLVPKAIKLLADSDLSSDEEAIFKLFDLWLKEYWIARQDPISLALELCKVIEKLIDKEVKDD